MSEQPGRVCPLRYRYGPRAIARAPAKSVETLYVVGGLYGNLPALNAIEQLAAREAGPVTLCFNGDFNWFNVDDCGFREINERVLTHDLVLGNVEAELASASPDTGCGCAYPDSVDAATVERSNRIHARLLARALRHPELCARLAYAPMFARYRVGDLTVGVVHGDAESLAGWRFDAAALDAADGMDWLSRAAYEAQVDLFASSHTCMPVEQVSTALEGIYHRLREYRSTQVLVVDDKAVAAWNGLALSALAKVVAVDARYQSAAERLAAFLQQQVGGDQSLVRALDVHGASLREGTLEDYVLVARGLLDWHQVSGDTAAETAAQGLVDKAWRRIHDGEGWHRERRPLLRYGQQHALIDDHFIPSPTALMLDLMRNGEPATHLR